MAERRRSQRRCGCKQWNNLHGLVLQYANLACHRSIISIPSTRGRWPKTSLKEVTLEVGYRVWTRCKIKSPNRTSIRREKLGSHPIRKSMCIFTWVIAEFFSELWMVHDQPGKHPNGGTHAEDRSSEHCARRWIPRTTALTGGFDGNTNNQELVQKTKAIVCL